MNTKPIALIAGASLMVLALAGCTPTPTPSSSPSVPAPASSSAAPEPSTTPVASASPTTAPTPTPTPTAVGDPDVLFTITVTATATGSNQARLNITETVYKPSKTATAAELAQLDKECDTWKTDFPSPKFVHATIVSKLAAGSPAWPKKIAALGMDLGSEPVWSGDYTHFEAACSPGILSKLPGTVNGVTPVPAVNSANVAGGWARSEYGFGTAYDADAVPAKLKFVYTNCSISLGPLAAANAIAAKWPKNPHTNGGYSCQFGTQSF